MKRPSTGATARARIRIIGRCRATPRSGSLLNFGALEDGPRRERVCARRPRHVDRKRNKLAKVEDAASLVSLSTVELSEEMMGIASRLGKNPNLADWVNECTIRYDESHLQDRH
jgi:hypothetical protein